MNKNLILNTSMKLVILRTDIKTKKKVKKVKPLLNNHPLIINWSIDLEDVDNVLRIEASNSLHQIEIKTLIQREGFFCGDLPEKKYLLA
ncbi:MAG: hypothetical protein JKY02_10655 [Flavobacteriaceae bacterium]|nr:hypothetical protein [Flavobacteriaceae bacterium]